MTNDVDPRRARVRRCYLFSFVLAACVVALGNRQPKSNEVARPAWASYHLSISELGAIEVGLNARSIRPLPAATRDKHGSLFVAPGDGTLGIVTKSTFKSLGVPNSMSKGALGAGVRLSVDAQGALLIFRIGGDSLWICPSLDRCRSRHLPRSSFYIIGTGSRLLVNAVGDDDEAVGFPLHLYDSSGRRIKSFGASAAHYRFDQPSEGRRLLSAGRFGAVWAVKPDRYELQEFDSLGNQLAQRKPRGTWNPLPAGSPQKPSTRIVAIRQRSDGLLLILMNVPDHRYKEQRNYSPTMTGSDDLFRDTVIDLVDSATGSLLSSTTLDASLSGLSDDSTAYGLSTRGNRTYVSLWRAAITSTQ